MMSSTSRVTTTRSLLLLGAMSAAMILTPMSAQASTPRLESTSLRYHHQVRPDPCYSGTPTFEWPPSVHCGPDN
ncbi:hypothetical protein ITJ44_10340 [Clavibacter sp. VKM Ac-2873]|uniref:hypothetical protein n=1 Tax=Clavibacter sp. VKM Ac-2873 TaxID=2783813 RepID=UPI00188C9900|nr:hypothetical protein [Clavibacter sp. VKM Ac-2873]MBF4618470.1 hypothetical protein [Clavibacter sp. VKM Ac-2873]